MCEFLKNPFKQNAPFWLEQSTAFDSSEIINFHRTLDGYKPTPLHHLHGFAESLNLKSVIVKDESFRFGVNAFKPLGASYAIFRFLKDQWQKTYGSDFEIVDFKNAEKMKQLGAFTFCAATDGNHGRAVAWTAKMLKQSAVIYMPSSTAKSRIHNIKSEGAEVRLINGTFDECVACADLDAEKNGWIIISDTAYPGYMYYPQYIMAGYSTIFKEMDDFFTEHPFTADDIVILQAGVGGLAAAGIWYFTKKFRGNSPRLLVLEPVKSDAFLESVKNGKPSDSKHQYDSIMAGLNCGVSLLAWDYVKYGADYLVTVSDIYAERAMQSYYFPLGNDIRIISGESGASGMACLLALMQNEDLKELKKQLNPGKESSVLIINSEGDTDPENFQKVISEKIL